MAVSQEALGFASGTTIFKDTNNANAPIVVKSSSATVYVLDLDNSANGAASYVKFYNTAGAVVVGTTIPDEVILLPASTIVKLAYVGGKIFGTGLQVATVTAGGTAGNTSPSSAVVVQIVYV